MVNKYMDNKDSIKTINRILISNNSMVNHNNNMHNLSNSMDSLKICNIKEI